MALAQHDTKRPPRKAGLVRNLLARHPLLPVMVAVLLVLCVLVLYPAAILVRDSLTGPDGEFTLRWYVEAYSRTRTLTALWNTLIIASATALLATVLGTLMAWAVVRTDMPMRRLVEAAALVPFISTPFIGGLAWILLASPETGLINQAWRVVTGAEAALLDIHGMWGIIMIEALYEMPYVFLIVAGALRSMDPTLEEASFAAGAGLTRTTLRVTLPMVLPAIIGGGLLVFVLAAEQFGVPAVIGGPARITVLTTAIWETQATYPPRYGLGSALSMTLLAIALIGLWAQRRVLGDRSFTTVGGKGARPRRVELGRWRWIALAVCLGYLILSVILPYATIILSSLRTIWTQHFDLSQLTLEHYRWVLFDYPMTQRAMLNSLLLATGGATIGILFCAVISFLAQRSRVPGRRALDYLAVLPMAFPGVVLAFALLRAYITPPLVLYGTIWILLIAYITRYIPYGVRSTSATLMQIHPELEESSLSSGANWFQTFRRVTLPLLKPGLVAGWIMLFVSFMRELSASVLLYSPGNEVLSVAIYDLWAQGNFRPLSALAVIQIVLCLIMLILVKRLARVDTDLKV